jgi:hypothetical protein
MKEKSENEKNCIFVFIDNVDFSFNIWFWPQNSNLCLIENEKKLGNNDFTIYIIASVIDGKGNCA